MQLSSRLRRGDLVDFFSSVGRVRDAKIVAEKGSRRSRGVAYVEFYSIDSAVEAVKLSGQKLLGVPIIVQPSDAQKNRQSTVKQYSADGAPVGSANNTLVYVHGIMVDMEPEDLSEFFDLFGRVDYCHLFSVEADEWAAFVKFDMPAAAQAAVKKLNGLELFGARLQVRTARKSEQEREAQRTADQEMQMDATDQTKQDKDKALKQKSPPLLTNNKIPANHDSQIAAVTIGDEAAYRVLRLFNMFDPREEPGNSDDWIRDIEQDVSGECSGFGQVDGVRVEPKSATGSVLVQFADKVAARSAYLAMNQRWFGGRKIDAALVPDDIWAGQHVFFSTNPNGVMNDNSQSTSRASSSSSTAVNTPTAARQTERLPLLSSRKRAQSEHQTASADYGAAAIEREFEVHDIGNLIETGDYEHSFSFRKLVCFAGPGFAM
ncbi:splicing factor [Coemansia erecta]|nr:splicing factor [Coemansia erecta]